MVKHCAKCNVKYHSPNDECKGTNIPSVLYSYLLCLRFLRYDSTATIQTN